MADRDEVIDRLVELAYVESQMHDIADGATVGVGTERYTDQQDERDHYASASGEARDGWSSDWLDRLLRYSRSR